MKTENLIALLLVIVLFLTLSISLKYKNDKPLILSPKTPNVPEQIEPETPKLPPEVVPEFQTFLTLRNIDGLGKVLSDIEGHMPAGHIYSDPDKITWGHETTHGINSVLRVQASRRVTTIDDRIEIDHVGAWLEDMHGKKVFKSFARINAFYVLEDRSVIINEPNTTVNSVAEAVPQSLRGEVYDLYMIRQARSWNDTPLYVLDEFVAYSNGSAVRKDLSISERAETVKYMLEFIVYSISLAMVIDKECPEYDDKQFKSFLTWQIKRSMEIYNQEEKALEYLTTVRNSADAESFRKFAREYFGKEWTQEMLGF